jgi:hypothetical protein
VIGEVFRNYKNQNNFLIPHTTPQYHWPKADKRIYITPTATTAQQKYYQSPFLFRPINFLNFEDNGKKLYIY